VTVQPAPLIDVGSVPDTPSLVIDVGVVEANLARMAALARAHGVALRPHTKTHKLPQLARRQSEVSSSGITVAKLGEAETMAEAGLTDILVAYPIVGDQKMGRLADLTRTLHISVAVDSLPVGQAIDRALAKSGATVDVLLEIDTGLHRCGVAAGDVATSLALQIARLPRLNLIGIMTHEGHAYAGRGRRHADRVGRDAATAMVRTAEQIRGLGLELPVVSLGCSITVDSAAAVPGVTEVRPGTYVYNDRSQLLQGACSAGDCAARVVATVVSRPAHDRAVIDAGSKALGLDRALARPTPEGYGVVVDRSGWQVDRLSEEHGVLIRSKRGSRLAIGDRIEIVPNHICSVVNLFSTVYVASNGIVHDQWSIAGRGRSQ
jgi:D-serine deaminase-like pyridoxal phosphate-dependent protein